MAAVDIAAVAVDNGASVIVSVLLQLQLSKHAPVNDVAVVNVAVIAVVNDTAVAIISVTAVVNDAAVANFAIVAVMSCCTFQYCCSFSSQSC